MMQAETMQNHSISFRPLSRADFPLLQRWLGESHVAMWWREPTGMEAIEAKFGPRIEGSDPVHVFIIDYGERPVGWIQWYRWADFTDHAAQLGADLEAAGMDLAIGEQDVMGMGVGSRAIGKFLNQIIFAGANIRAVITDPQESNVRSLRAFEKVGFTTTKTVQLRGEDFRRSVIKFSRAG